jgi:hypothetical protein
MGRVIETVNAAMSAPSPLITQEQPPKLTWQHFAFVPNNGLAGVI